MTDTQQATLLFLKNAVTGQMSPVPDGLDMAAIVEISRRHHLSPLVYAGAVACGISKTDPNMQILFRQTLSALMKSECQLRALEKLEAAFCREGINYLPLKGCHLKQLYPKPELRTMSDADILISMDQYPAIRSILIQQGYTEQGETNHELIWTSSELFLELHKRLIPSYNKDYYDYYGDGWRLALPCGGGRHTMIPEDEYVFLFTHFAKHYRDGGAGIRYLLDLYVFRRAFPDLDEDVIGRELTMLRLDRFYRNITRLLAWWWGDGESDPVLELLSEAVFSGGTWGDLEAHRASRQLRSLRSGRIKRGLYRIFPPAEVLSRRYRVLKKHPWLTPVYWPVRWFRVILFRPERLRSGQKPLPPEVLRARARHLHTVGLDFEF